MAKVKREMVVACMTCSFCDNLLRDATTISECLHTYPPMKHPGQPTTMTGELFWGYFFVIIGSLSFFGFVFAVMASTLFPLSQNHLNQGGLKNERYYYCFLVPLTLPVITVAVYFHWLSMKLFKHA